MAREVGKADIAFGVTLAFLMGTLLAGASAVAWFVALTVVLVALGLMRKAIFFVCVIALVFGFLYYHLYVQFVAEGRVVLFNEEVILTGVVVREPQVRGESQFVTLALKSPHRGRVVVHTDRYARIHYGDVVTVKGIVRPPRSDAEAPFVSIPETTVVEQHRGSRLREALFGLKARLVEGLRLELSPDAAALAAGITFGSRSDFTEDMRDNMAASGTTHLVALSGYNIAILVLVVARSLGYLVSRRMTFYLTGIAIVLFILMVGGEASVVRAGIMGFLVLLARHTGRAYRVRNVIFLAAAAMVLVNPTIISGDVGFQLSFLSVLGLVYLAPVIAGFLNMGEEQRNFLGWRENAVMTLSAQLAVAPLLIHYFDTFSLTALAANVLVLGVVPLTMFLGVLVAVFGALGSVVGTALSWLLEVVVQYQLFVIDLFARLSVPVHSVAGGAFIVALYYGALAFLVAQHHRRTRVASSVI